jgi:hypothetical protein
MTSLEIEEALSLGLEITLALVNAVRRALTKQAALIHVKSIIEAKLIIDADVDAAANGTKPE